LGNFPAASILKVLEDKPIGEIDDQTLIMADLSRKAIQQVQRFVRTLLKTLSHNRKFNRKTSNLLSKR